jgi:hypothetical protein
MPNFYLKVAQKSQNINIKPKFESPKHQHEASFETLKYIQTLCFETAPRHSA